MQAASCAGSYTTECPADAKYVDQPNPWVLTGALVNGPQSPQVDTFKDLRPQPDVRVSIEYNAGYTGKSPVPTIPFSLAASSPSTPRRLSRNQ